MAQTLSSLEKTEQLNPGDRIKLKRMNGDPDPVPLDTEGEVIDVRNYERFATVSVAWDNGRRLLMCCPPDDFDIV